ncbi:MAG: zf-HC2 domain-containing protein [Nitrospiraceae bacterium]|jgi:predicted anti-sigma-YlaC factor YlaD|nr:zf-HC2 domain-containing protein [Nitrospiraceae bacterium]
MTDCSSQCAHSGLTCRDLTERVSEYLDDNISILTKVRIGLHLASCTHCRTYVQQIDLVSSALSCLPNLYPPPMNRLRLQQQFATRYSN